MSPQSTFESMLVDQLRPHPKNIRHEVIPTDELVASIKQDGILQPLVVSPHPTLEGDYTLIAGHHRLAAAKKAGLSELPVVIRHDLDTEGKQLAAMVAENMHRTDITATEEADAYQAMLDLGEWDVKQIAKATGHKQARVKDRLKLGKLAEPQRKALDDGQLTIERALVIAEYADHPDLQEMLTKSARSPYDWDYRVKDAQRTADWRQEEPALRAELAAAGVELVDRPEAPAWRADFPYKRVDADSPEEAAALGAMAVLDDECVRSGGPMYVVEKPDTAGGLTEEEQTRQEAFEARKARIQDMEDRLAPLVEVETEWIRTIVAGAARSERTSRVISRHAAATLLPQLASYGDYQFGNRLIEYFGIDLERGDHWPTKVSPHLSKLSLVELTTLLTILLKRKTWIGLRAWQPDYLNDPEDSTAQWFALRAELGWQETDVEREAKALAAELWPPEPLEDDEDVEEDAA